MSNSNNAISNVTLNSSSNTNSSSSSSSSSSNTNSGKPKAVSKAAMSKKNKAVSKAAASKKNKKPPSAKQVKMKENMATAASKLRSIPGWTPTAANITGLMGVTRAKGDENTFIRHAISRFEKRQIDKEILGEQKVKTVKKPRKVKSAVMKEEVVSVPSNTKTAKKKRTKKVKEVVIAPSPISVAMNSPPTPIPSPLPANKTTAKKKRTKKAALNTPAASTSTVVKKKRTPKPKVSTSSTNKPMSNNSVSTAVIIDATAPTTAAKNAPVEEEINY